jgi:hypothetical protein
VNHIRLGIPLLVFAGAAWMLHASYASMVLGVVIFVVVAPVADRFIFRKGKR